MNILKFGEITPQNIMEQKGAKLAALLKTDIMYSNSINHVFNLYGKIYRNVDDALYSFEHAIPYERGGINDIQNGIYEIKDFFQIISGRDITRKIISLDFDRGINSLFKVHDNTNVVNIIRFMLYFFDYVSDTSMKDLRTWIENIKSDDDLKNILLSKTEDSSMFLKMDHNRLKFNWLNGFRI